MRDAISLGMVTVLVLAVLVAVPVSDVSEAAEGYDEVYYCYGDTATFQHPIDEAEPSWEYSKDGGPVQTSEERVLSVSIDDCDTLSITQHLQGTEKTILVHSMHVMDDEDELFTITFHDGETVLSIERHLDRTSAIREGDLFVMPVDDLTKEGYVFGGWYTDPSFAEGTEFDPRDPVEDDMDVYALWVADPGHGDSDITVPDHINTVHVVTFDTAYGLEYDIVSSTSTSVTFTVSVVGGFELRDGTLSVTSNGGTMSESDGTYVLSGIDRNITVTIDGDVLSILEPDDPVPAEPSDDGGFPWWVVVIVILVVLVAAAAYWRLRSGRTG